jgi:plastocyanin
MLRTILLAAALLGTSALTHAEEYVIKQEHKAFSVGSLQAKVGDVLAFVNYDPFVHNIFSLSEVQSFDLGTFGKGEVRKVKLLSPGTLEIECAVHPEMRLTIEVTR